MAAGISGSALTQMSDGRIGMLLEEKDSARGDIERERRAERHQGQDRERKMVNKRIGLTAGVWKKIKEVTRVGVVFRESRRSGELGNGSEIT